MGTNNVINFYSWKPKKKPSYNEIAKKLEREEILERSVVFSLDEVCILTATLTKHLEYIQNDPDIKNNYEDFLKNTFEILEKLITSIDESNSIDDMELRFNKLEIDTILLCLEALPTCKNNVHREGPLCIYSDKFNKEDIIENTISYIYAVFKGVERQIEDRINKIEGNNNFIEEHLDKLSEFFPSFQDQYIQFFENIKYHKEMYEQQYLSKHIILLEDTKLVKDVGVESKVHQLTTFYIKPRREPFSAYDNTVYEGNDVFKYLSKGESFKYTYGWRAYIKTTYKNNSENLSEIEQEAIQVLKSHINECDYEVVTLSDIQELYNDKLDFLKFISDMLTKIDLEKYPNSRETKDTLKKIINITNI